MANTNSDDGGDRSRTLPRERWPWLEHRGSGERQSIGQTEETMANTKSEWSNDGQHGEREKTTPKSRLRREAGASGQEVASSAHRQPSSDIWNLEPNVGRVAHGIADRVDRLRLLGNGVVPQTAARAWEVLNARD